MYTIVLVQLYGTIPWYMYCTGTIRNNEKKTQSYSLELEKGGMLGVWYLKTRKNHTTNYYT